MAKRKRLDQSPCDDSDGPDRTHEKGGEFYINMIQQYDKTRSTQKIYAEASLRLQGWLKRQWLRFCEITQLDPIEQLKLFPIGVLNSFFHWLLHERSDTLHAKSIV